MTTSLSFCNILQLYSCISDKWLYLKLCLGRIPKKSSCLFSFILANCHLYNMSQKRLRKRHQPSIFYLFLFIDDNVHHNFYTMMFHVVSINLLKLFLRFILLLPGGLYIWCYGPYTCCCAEKTWLKETDGVILLSKWKWYVISRICSLDSMQQRVNRARTPKHVMQVQMYSEEKYLQDV